MGKILEFNPRNKDGTGKPKCIDCNKQLASFYAKRCILCSAKKRVSNPEFIEKLSKAKKGLRPKNFYEMQKKAWEANRGKKHSEEWKRKISESHRGEKSYCWIKDRTKLVKRQERNDSTYYAWRMDVWRRDNFKCKISNQDCLGRLEAHHILGWTEFPELRYEINNGITLCHAHHPRKRAEEKRLIPFFKELVEVSKV